jgi:hypothetical protein
MAVDVHMPVFLAVAVERRTGTDHGTMLYYNITGVYFRRFCRSSSLKADKSTSREARGSAGISRQVTNQRETREQAGDRKNH